jgi:hypothetical protein
MRPIPRIHSWSCFTHYKYGCIIGFPHICVARDIISLLCIHFLHLFRIVNKSGHHLKTTTERHSGAEVKLRPLLSRAVDGQLHADARYIEGCSASKADLYVVAKRKNSIPVPGIEHRSSSLLLVTILSSPGSRFQCLTFRNVCNHLIVNRVLCLGLQNRVVLY